MARWGKNIVVPLDSLYKEKENTNRPTAARSAGTVGKWGKMGFTSTRTYALQSITAEVSPGQSPDAAAGSTGEGDSSPVREAPKPKKFFKSRGSATTLVAAQLIQHLPRAPPSPIRDVYPASGSTSMPITVASQHRTPIKLKVPKPTVERKNSTSSTEKVVKPKKKKEEKKLKPEAPPSRIISRSRKVVNYNEDDDFERCPTPKKDIILPKTASSPESDGELEPEADEELSSPVRSPLAVPVVPPPLPPPVKTPSIDHPPIVLRISKGTSRLVSTDSEEQLNSPQHDFQNHINNQHSSSVITYNTTPTTPLSSSEPHKTSTSSNSDKTQLLEQQVTTPSTIPHSATAGSSPTIPKVTVKPLPVVQNSPSDSDYLPLAPSTVPTIPAPTPYIPQDEAEEFNYCTVKISPDKPPKERLKLIIKTDVIRNALAAAAAAAAAAASNSAVISDKPEKEKKSKSKKHKHLKHIMAASKEGEFKTPSPQQSTDSNYRTIISPPALSEKDFDSQSSVLGSISSKGNSTPMAQAIPDESCVIRSRGSSDITSDLETSQHSSLVAPPSDIESRLESMMDGEDVGSEALKEAVAVEEPLQEDILEVLTGGIDAVEELQQTTTAEEELPVQEEPPSKRTTRGGKKPVTVKEAATPEEADIKEISSESIEPTQEVPSTEEQEIPTPRRTRRGNVQQTTPEIAVELPSRRTRRKNPPTKTPVEEVPEPMVEEPIPPKRGGRPTRNNNLNNNNKSPTTIKTDTVQQPTATTPTVLRSYGRKRKNPLPTNEEMSLPAKISSPNVQPTTDIDIPASAAAAKTTSSIDIPDELGEPDSNTIPKSFDEPVSLVIPKLTAAATNEDASQRRDYKIKDKFKRTWLERDAREQQEAAEKAAAAEQLAKSSSDGADARTNLDQDQELQQPTAMKLVISKKKGSIFKSRVADQFPKRHLYKHRWDEQLNGDKSQREANPNDSPIPAKTTVGEIFEDFSESCEDTSDVPQPKLTRFVKQPTGSNKFDEEPVTSVRCERKAKEYYTVVRNVKTAHQIQEFGEYQEINDDVDYFLEALQPHNQISTRCLSAIKLASKCMTPGFRMHVRAHGVVTKFFKALSDAHKDLSLGLCTSAIMFILSQDALNMDLDRDSLELMMNLLEVDETDPVYFPEITSYNRNKKTVTELCEEIKNQGKAAHLNMDSISSGTLAMETLLSLTSKRAGEWFKEELRNLGGLEHIIKVICDCCTQIMTAEDPNSASINWTPSLLESLKTIERCLRVLENVTQLNEQNQNFILSFSSNKAINTLFRLYKMFDREICVHPTTDLTSKNNPGVIIREALIPTLKVLINITHPFDSNANGSALLGQRREIFDTSFHILLQAPNYIPERCVFELSMLVLLLLINLTMHTVENRTFIMKATAPSDFKSMSDDVPAVKALIDYFFKCEELARLVEKNTDAILDNTEQKKKQEEVDETVNNLLQKAGHHMEHTLKGSYAGILIAHLITDSEENETVVRTYLRENGFKDITSVLEKYYTFMNLTASSEATIVAHIKSTKKLIDYLKKRDIMNETGTAPTSTTPTKYNDSASTSSNSSPAITTRSTQRVYKTYSQR